MHWNGLVLLAGLLSSVAQASPGIIKIETKVSGQDVNILSFNEPKVVAETFDASGEILDSKLTLNLSGVIEGNTCSFDHIAIQPIYSSTLSSYPNETYNVNILKWRKESGAISMNEYFCAAVSFPTPFSAQITAFPNGWGGSTKEVTWTYLFKYAHSKGKKLSVTLSQTKGWSWKFEEN